MICEIINPSDPYTLKTDNFNVAAVAIAMIGNGQIGLKNIDGEESTPVLFGWDEWFKENDITDISNFIESNKIEMAEVLDSVLIGDENDRNLVEEIIGMLDKGNRKKWLKKYHDKKRSSMNDIGNVAWSYANKLRKL